MEQADSVAIAGKIDSAAAAPSQGSSPWAYCLTLVPGVLVVAGNLEGRYWTLAIPVWTSALAMSDWLTRIDRRPQRKTSATIPDLILALHVVLHTAAVATLLCGVWAGWLRQTFLWFAVASTGIHSGINGINSAHEMIHRRSRWWRRAGLWCLMLVHYGHWCVSHLRVHHRWVGTARDPVTARRGETVYGFVLRAVPGQLFETLRVEADRLGRCGLRRFGPSNEVVVCLLVQAGLTTLVGLALGRMAATVWLVQSAIAVLDLELVNYLQHYGLTRRPEDRLTAGHSWQCDRVSSRFTLLELSRHSDHHLHASKPYHTLVSHERSPSLPVGYYGLMATALIPPWWFAFVHPILDAHLAESDAAPLSKPGDAAAPSAPASEIRAAA